jgi:Ca2+-binding RTX toxin-like protein
MLQAVKGFNTCKSNGDRTMTVIPTFNPTAFVPGAVIDNPYFPLKPGNISVYEGEPVDQKQGEPKEINRSAVTYEIKDIAGVAATVVRDTNWADGFLQEDTQDSYAQDRDGNVWYLGEATTSFKYDDNGNFIGTSNSGAWEAGINQAQPGYIMKANPQVGDGYYQEFSPNDQAIDQAKITSRNKTLNTDFGTFKNGLQTLEFTDVHPGVFEYKYYAPGIGVVRVEEELDQNLKPGFVSELDSMKSVSPKAFTSENGTKGNDVIDGNDRSNNLKGFRGDDLLQGLGGNDRLTGFDGNDFLIGGDGVDTLSGGNGQDILVGGKGADILKGGKGRDQFVFRTLEEKGDRIKDFTRSDVIIVAEIFAASNYSGSDPFDYLKFEQRGSSTVIRIDPDGKAGSKPFEVLATLEHTSANSLSKANFVV